MQVRHPRGDVDIAVDVAGEHVPVADGVFEIPDERRGWLESFAAAYGTDPESLVVDETPTCAGNSGECSRTVDEQGGYCWQHGED